MNRLPSSLSATLLCALVALGLSYSPACAADEVSGVAETRSATPTSDPLRDLGRYESPEEMPGEVGAEAQVTDRRGETLPLDATFDDEEGNRVELGSYFGGQKPVLVQFVYFRCPGLCNAVLNGTLEAITELKSMQIGQDYDLITISINPSETANLARAKKAAYLRELGRPEAAPGWHFLTGNEQEIKRVTQAAGFGYRFDEESKEFAHGAALFVLTPEGKISRTIYGAYYEEQTVRLSLVEAADGKIGSALDRILLFCYHFDPDTGQYTTTVMQLTRVFGVLLSVLLFSSIVGFLWLERRQRARQAASQTSSESPATDAGESASSAGGSQ